MPPYGCFKRKKPNATSDFSRIPLQLPDTLRLEAYYQLQLIPCTNSGCHGGVR